jgi:hypothetical protein
LFAAHKNKGAYQKPPLLLLSRKNLLITALGINGIKQNLTAHASI